MRSSSVRRTITTISAIAALLGCGDDDKGNDNNDSGAHVGDGGDAGHTGIMDAGAKMDAGADTGTTHPDAAVDASRDATTDAGVDAGPQPLAPLQLCSEMDTRYGVTAATRSDTWDYDLMMNFGGAVYTDCKTANFFPSMSDDQNTEYTNFIVAYNNALFGCPKANVMVTADTYGLVNSGVEHVYSTADLKVFNDFYIQGLVDTIEMKTPNNPLSAANLKILRDRLDLLASQMPGVVTSPNLTLNGADCPN